MYSIEDIKNFREQISVYKLAAPYKLIELSNAELAEICNGWGPDSWPQWLRKTLTSIAGNYEVIAIPHDIRFEFRIGTAAIADAEFWENSLKIWRYRWGWRRWISPTAIKERFALRAAYIALKIGSQCAWDN